MIKVASFLSLSEVESIKTELTARRIEYFVSSKGTAPGRYHDPYYQVSVNAIDYFVARQIVARIIAKSFIENRKGPKCNALTYRPIEKKSLWERIYYFGTTRVQCQKCRTTYIMKSKHRGRNISHIARRGVLYQRRFSLNWLLNPGDRNVL